MDYKARQRRLQESLQPNRLDALLVTHLPNVRYLCGFTGSAGVLFVSDKKSVFFTDGCYRTQARAEVQGCKVVISKKGPLVACAEWLCVHNRSPRAVRRRIGIEGEHSSLPHGRASEATIPRSGFVVCDFGVILSGYCSDMTRTVYVGRPTAEARRVYESVRRAQEAAIEAVQPGVTVGEVDQAARK